MRPPTPSARNLWTAWRERHSILGMNMPALVGDFGHLFTSQAAGAILSSGLTAGVAALRWWVVKRLPAKRTWRFNNANSMVVVVASSAVIDTGVYQRPTTGIGQVRALALLAPSLMRAYRDIDLERVRMSSQPLGHEFESDLLILGGPKNNAYAEMVMGALSERLPFHLDYPTIRWGSTEYESVVEGGVVKTDVGYVIRAVNPVSPSHRLVIIGGLHTYGTTAAARWWADHGSSRTLPEDVAVLIKADVLPGDHAAPPQMLRHAALT